jgi:hypothetical protein
VARLLRFRRERHDFISFFSWALQRLTIAFGNVASSVVPLELEDRRACPLFLVSAPGVMVDHPG